MRSYLLGLLLSFAAAAQAEVLEIEELPQLDRAVSNNAVALVSTDHGAYLYSFLGLQGGKTWQDITSAAAVLEPGADRWISLAPVPGESGRLASSAVNVAGYARIWSFRRDFR